ncbi:hypothetical protein [Nioella aestuarii]|uniref:hypothetical protein n=1 Tax=Nioella aestuarii TaxID=1662864 RepID=UPI003D7F8A28
MLEAFKSLPEDPDALRAVSEQMARHIQSQAYQIEKLKAELHGHRKCFVRHTLLEQYPSIAQALAPSLAGGDPVLCLQPGNPPGDLHHERH